MSYLTIDEKPYRPLYLPKQLDIFWDGHTEQFNVIPKGRRFGITHGVSKFCTEKMLEGKTILWVDTVQGNLEKYYNKFFLPELKKFKPQYWQWRGTKKELVLCSGQLDMRSAERPENIEGFAYNIIIINEAGIVLKGQKGRELWYNSIYAMVLDYEADVYFVGTPKGKKAKKNEYAGDAPAKTSLYYDLAIKGGLKDFTRTKPSEEDIEILLEEARKESAAITEDALADRYKKHPKWRTLTYTSYDNPLLDPELIAELEADVPRSVRKQEIGGQFIDIGDEEIFKLEWFNVAYELPADHLWGRKIMSLDTAFKKGAENDDSAGVVFQEAFVNNIPCWFWVDCFCEKLEFPELLERAKAFYLQHQPDVCLVEDKASGQSLIQMMRRQAGFPIHPVTPDTDKVSRAVACTPWFSNGQIYIMKGHWNQMAIDQLCDFNALMDTPDDIVDAVSQLLNFIKSGGIVAPPPVSVPRQQRESKQLDGYNISRTRKNNMMEGYLYGK